ncbi:MAG: methyltransferase domain-containing protein [Armatimonadetes bacterium]|nr:methyltransferase domain-containing protein [Armatimonadota bacterium]
MGRSLDLTAAVAALRQVREAPGSTPAFRVTASRVGKQEYRSHDVTGADFGLFRWNACALPFGDATVDRIVANLPFCIRVGSHKKNPRLYRWFLDEAARVVKPGGRVVFLSLARRLVASLLLRYPRFTCVGRHPVNLGGLVPSAYVVDVSD